LLPGVGVVLGVRIGDCFDVSFERDTNDFSGGSSMSGAKETDAITS
jgi:hypothetical protein